MNPIYVVDDESAICITIEGILQDEGYTVVTCSDAKNLFDKILDQPPSLVLLDIWLPGINGMEVLKEFKERHPSIPVIMMSGHAGIESAVNSIKLGAYDFLEKPLHLEVLLDKVEGALARQNPQIPTSSSDTRLEIVRPGVTLHKDSVSLVESDHPQRTLKKNVVLNGTGLLSGRNTGVILSPLDVNAGIIFQSLDGQTIPGYITALENFSKTVSTEAFTANSTVLSAGNRRVRTVEHLMAVLHLVGITNVLIKTDGEIPNIDGSADDFCKLIREAGIEDQSERTKQVVIREKMGVGHEDINEKHLYVEPYNGLEVQMRVKYPAPIFEQTYTFNPEHQSFDMEIAPARTFNTFENIEMAQKLGRVGSGYLNAHIILHDGKVINTELRYPDEFVRHKILDLLGDLYLLGVPIVGRFTANMTSHGYNQALVKQIYSTLFTE